MKSSRWIVGSLLLVAALLALNLARPTAPSLIIGEALGQNRATAGGDYVVAAARTSSTSQLVYVVDVRLKRMAVYGNRPGTAGLQPIDMQDINRAFPNGCSSELILQPFSLSDRAEAVAVIDTVNKQMVTFVSQNYARLAPVGVVNLGTDLGK